MPATTQKKEDKSSLGSSKAAAQEEADTCDVLCSLNESLTQEACKNESKKFSCKQFQLPMFLSKTYHMIDGCDSGIAAWSEDGDNFIVKDTEQFASSVLPKYFKHSNFSSFARQLNFYGFRKLRTDPILTAEVDPRTACWVRFYHENFKKDKPELLHQIKRATKSDQQSKDDVEGLKAEVGKLRETLAQTTADYDRKLAELSYECNRRITAMNVEYDKLSAYVHSALANKPSATAVASAVPDASADLLHSLSQAAVSLQNHLRSPALSGLTAVDPMRVPPTSIHGTKRPSESGPVPVAKNQKTGE